MTTLMAHDPMTALMIGHIFNTKTDSMTDPKTKIVLHSCDDIFLYKYTQHIEIHTALILSKSTLIRNMFPSGGHSIKELMCTSGVSDQLIEWICPKPLFHISSPRLFTSLQICSSFGHI